MNTVVLWVSLLLAVVVAQDETPDDQDLALDTLDLSKRLSDLEKRNARNKRLQDGIPELRLKLNETKMWLEKTNKNIHKLCAYTKSVHQKAKNAGRHISWDIKVQLYSIHKMSRSLKKLQLKLKEKEDKYSEEQIKAYMARQWTKFKEEDANNIKQEEEPKEKTPDDKILDEQVEKFMTDQWNMFKHEVANNIKHMEEPQEKTTQTPNGAAKGEEEKKPFGSRLGNWFSSKRKSAAKWVSNRYGAAKNWWKKRLFGGSRGSQHDTVKKSKADEHEVAGVTALPKQGTTQIASNPVPVMERDDTPVDHAPESETADMTSDATPKAEPTDMTTHPAPKTETEQLIPIPASEPPTADETQADLESEKPAQDETAVTSDQVKLFVSRELKAGRPDLDIVTTVKPTGGSAPEELPSVARDPNKMNKEVSSEDQSKSSIDGLTIQIQ